MIDLGFESALEHSFELSVDGRFHSLYKASCGCTAVRDILGYNVSVHGLISLRRSKLWRVML